MSFLTSGFIDLATHGEMEQKLYGGPTALTYFVRQTKKCTWFTQVPCKLSKQTGFSWGGTSEYSISRAGDYLLDTWLEIDLVGPSFTLAAPSGGATLAAQVLIRQNQPQSVCWVKNIGHRLIKEVSLTFNDLTACKMTGEHLEFWAAFSVPDSKRAAYNRMIGAGNFVMDSEGHPMFHHGAMAAVNASGTSTGIEGVGLNDAHYNMRSQVQNLHVPAALADAGSNQDATVATATETAHQVLLDANPENALIAASVASTYTPVTQSLRIPIPFFYARDTGLALPTAALPYNDMKIKVVFREYADLLTATNGDGMPLAGWSTGSNIANFSAPTISGDVHANYAVVTNDERTLMGAAPRDIVIEQPQLATITPIPAADSVAQLDLRFNHSVKALFFGVRATTKAETACIGSQAVNAESDIDQYSSAANQVLQKLAHEACNNPLGRRPGSVGYVFDEMTENAADNWMEANNLLDASDEGSFARASYQLAVASGNSSMANKTRLAYTAGVAAGARSNVNGVYGKSYNPVKTLTLKYENTTRLETNAEYFSEVQPFNSSVGVPVEKGYHCYSYGLHLDSVDPTGSTNFGKLTNVNMSVALHRAGNGVSDSATGKVLSGQTGEITALGVYPSHVGGKDRAQTRELVVTAVNWNICRISGGALGFPIL